MTSGNDTRATIEKAIVEARDGVGRRIEEIDQRLRRELDLNKIASEHAPQLMAAGAAIGFVIGYGVPKAVLRMIQIAVPIAVAIRVAKTVGECAIEENFV